MSNLCHFIVVWQSVGFSRGKRKFEDDDDIGETDSC